MGRPRKYSGELRRRAVAEILERDRKIPDVARDLGIGSPETLRRWVRRSEVDQGLQRGPTTEEPAGDCRGRPSQPPCDLAHTDVLGAQDGDLVALEREEAPRQRGAPDCWHTTAFAEPA